MNRRTLFGRMAALAAAAVVAPAVGGEVVEAAQDTPTLNETGLYVRSGEWRMAVNGHDVGSVQSVIDSERAEARAEGYERREFIEAKRTENRAQEISFYGTDPVPVIGYMVALENQTFEAMQAGCAARGCSLENQYSIERLRHEFFHMKRGQEWPDETLTMRHADPQKVYAWLKELHA